MVACCDWQVSNTDRGTLVTASPTFKLLKLLFMMDYGLNSYDAVVMGQLVRSPLSRVTCNSSARHDLLEI